jgi:hypothetical protein
MSAIGTIALVATLCLATRPSPAVKEGGLYRKNCSGCHGDLKERAEAGRSMNRTRTAVLLLLRANCIAARSPTHFIECSASRFPSGSSNCAMEPYSPMLVFGIIVLPPFALILRRVSGMSSTVKYTTDPAWDGS